MWADVLLIKSGIKSLTGHLQPLTHRKKEFNYDTPCTTYVNQRGALSACNSRPKQGFIQLQVKVVEIMATSDYQWW